MMNTTDMEIKERFTTWLGSPIPAIFQHGKPNGNFITIVRVKKDADFDYLYMQLSYHGAIELGGTFKYAGIYCKCDGLIYDEQHELCYELCSDLTSKPWPDVERAKGTLQRKMMSEVRQTVENIIDNDRSNLRVSEISDASTLRSMEHFQKYGAAKKAREEYLCADTGYAFVYKCSYIGGGCMWSEDAMLGYIRDPASHVAAQAVAYLDDSVNQENILSKFLEGDLIAAAYASLVVNGDNNAHTIKKIMKAMKGSDAKMVRVTVYKNGIEFTFKTEADQLRSDCGTHYSIWNIAGADRRAFEKLFGRHESFAPEEIIRIEYGRKALYEREQV